MSEVDAESTGLETSGASRTFILSCIGLALLPFVALCLKEFRFGLYFPYWDAWQFSLFLQKASTEGVGFGDFWAQHNEHRSVFPRLVMYALAGMSGWNVGWELVVNVLLGLGTFLLLWRMAFRDGRRPWWLVPVFSFLVFSWVQMENWIWGWQIHVFLSTFAVVAGVFALTGGRLNPVRFTLALCAGGGGVVFLRQRPARLDSPGTAGVPGTGADAGSPHHLQPAVGGGGYPGHSALPHRVHQAGGEPVHRRRAAGAPAVPGVLRGIPRCADHGRFHARHMARRAPCPLVRATSSRVPSGSWRFRFSRCVSTRWTGQSTRRCCRGPGWCCMCSAAPH